ncbi:expressed unknown protein [Seminavis robusta]|uniref:Uncharacterized protein n=1 Tax=Seminavis robusta TaxID=568900 RepID=A0A9N8DEY0_9STRA|nr:expressed unknown protein [Seminavis robusta]|eukprot:Sro61_g035090.1 n/a (427) ;mRNA; f:89461-90882
MVMFAGINWFPAGIGNTSFGSSWDGEEEDFDEEKPFRIDAELQYGSFPSDITVGSLQRTQSVCSLSTMLPGDQVRYIRFQVVIWHIGPIDAVNGKVDMRFRVTIFWNRPDNDIDDKEIGYGMTNPNNKKVWAMYGRQRAYERVLKDVPEGSRIVYVPPVSILNAVDFEILGEPEVCCVNASKGLMKWSCLYKASLAQEHLHVANFPHDSHDLILRLGVLKHRQNRKRWDRRRWKLALASAEDTQDTIRIPHGLVVDHVRVPGFAHNKKILQFNVVPMEFGGETEDIQPDQCLQVKLRVSRDSSYYDRNIIPLLAALNVVAISTIALTAEKFGSRGEMQLAISFVEIGVRMTLDSRLPIVGYQIKMQRVLNNFFYGLLFLTLESSFNYILYEYRSSYTKTVDQITAILSLLHLILILCYYKKHRDPP